MTQSYSQLKRRIEALQAKAEQLRQREISGVVSRIKTAIQSYGLTSDHLFGGTKAVSKGSNGSRGKKRSSRHQYADGNGNTWGGRGPRPQWLRAELEAGKALNDFLATAPSTQTTAIKLGNTTSGGKTPAAKQTRKRASLSRNASKPKASRQAYSDGAHTWSGWGPQPAWLKAAVASGQSLDSLKVAV
jgi:DNA-binding protein H-NS